MVRRERRVWPCARFAADDASCASKGGAASRIVIGDRKYDEVWAAVAQFHAAGKQKGVRVACRPNDMLEQVLVEVLRK